MLRQVLSGVTAVLVACFAVAVLAAMPVTTAFTYQGQLKMAGVPLDGPADMQFTLWDAPNGGAQASPTLVFGGDGPIIDELPIDITNGLFSVDLDFGATVFNGDARWLEIAVRSPSGGGEYTTLVPRQPVTGTPYALSVRVPLALNGDEPGGQIVSATNTAGSGVSYGGYFESKSDYGFGVSGSVTSESTYGCGVRGLTASKVYGSGVCGSAYADSGQTTGGAFQSSSDRGTGVHAQASSPSGYTFGVQAYSNSTSGIAVYGQATAATGGTTGVYGMTRSPYGIAVRGEAMAASGPTYGVYGTAASPAGTAVRGEAMATSGTTYGVYGTAASPDGYGGYFSGRGYFSGDVGIGTSAPTHKLDVSGGGNGAYAAQIYNPGGDGQGLLITGSDGSGTNPLLRVETLAQLPQFVVQEDGNVGIGTTNPVSRLMVQQSTDTNVSGILITNSAVARSLHLWTDQNNQGRLDVGTAADYPIILNGAGSGNVGIGTTSPTSKLEVRATGDGASVLKLATERPWEFRQVNSGSSAALELRATVGGKAFRISGLTPTSDPADQHRLAVFRTDPIPTSRQVSLVPDGGQVHIGGYLGIGTTSPASPLHVVNQNVPIAQFEDNGPYAARVELKNGQGGTWTLGVQGLPNQAPMGALYLQRSSSPEVVFAANGYTGIGVVNPTYRLQLPNVANNSGRALANRWDTYSSSRWKQNVVPIDGALEKTMALRGVYFDWKDQQAAHRDIGFLAEEVGAVVPELVTWEADGQNAQSLAYDRISALVVEAVKEQQCQIDALNNENVQLRAKLDRLETLVQQLASARSKTSN